jgi:hypothetical protein
VHEDSKQFDQTFTSMLVKSPEFTKDMQRLTNTRINLERDTGVISVQGNRQNVKECMSSLKNTEKSSVRIVISDPDMARSVFFKNSAFRQALDQTSKRLLYEWTLKTSTLVLFSPVKSIVKQTAQDLQKMINEFVTRTITVSMDMRNKLLSNVSCFLTKLDFLRF